MKTENKNGREGDFRTNALLRDHNRNIGYRSGARRLYLSAFRLRNTVLNSSHLHLTKAISAKEFLTPQDNQQSLNLAQPG